MSSCNNMITTYCRPPYFTHFGEQLHFEKVISLCHHHVIMMNNKNNILILLQNGPQIQFTSNSYSALGYLSMPLHSITWYKYSTILPANMVPLLQDRRALPARSHDLVLVAMTLPQALTDLVVMTTEGSKGELAKCHVHISKYCLKASTVYQPIRTSHYTLMWAIY